MITTKQQKKINKMIVSSSNNYKQTFSLDTYGKTFSFSLLYICVLLLLIFTPFTNWIIPFVSGLKKYKIKLSLSNDDN